MKKLYSVFVLFTLLFCYTGNVWGDELTVDGTSTAYLPIYGTWADASQHNQFIIPASELEEMQNGTITGLTFYSKTSSAGCAPTVKVSLANVSQSDLQSGLYSGSVSEVWSGTFSLSSSQWVLNFSSDNTFDYGDDNLLVDIVTTTDGNYNSSLTFYGFSYTNGGLYSYNSTNTIQSTVPKVTFTYTKVPVSCPKPTLSLDDKDDESVSFSWTEGGTETQWQYVCKAGSTAPTDSEWESATLTSDKSATIDGLSANTSYTFYLRAYCAANDQSKAVKNEFKTDCGIESIPADGWTYCFETSDGASTGSVPSCWLGLPSSGSYPTIDAGFVKEGSNKLHFQGKNTTQYIVLPEFNVAIKNLKISFWLRRDADYSKTDVPQVGYFSTTEPTTSSTFTSLGSPASVSTTYTRYVLDLGSATEGAKRIAIKFTGATSTSYTGGLFIDSMRVVSVQDCSAPQNVALSGSSISTADFSWDANAGVDSYKYCVVAQGEDADWSEDLTANTNSAHVEDLTPGDYTFYVKCACGTAATSLDFEIVSCPSVTGVTLSNQLWNAVTVNWTTSATTNCDVQYKAGSGEWTAAETNTSATSKTITGLSVGTTYSFRVKPNCSTDGWVSPASTYAPACPALGDLTLSNKTYNGVTISWSEVAGISTWNLRYRKESDSWTEVNNIAALTYTIASGLVTNKEYTIELYSECGGSASSTTYNPVYEIPAVLTASPVKDVTATLNWSTVDGASGYQYSCVKTGQADSWSVTQVTNSVALSGLEVAEEYTAKVRAVFSTGNSEAKEKVFSTVCQAPTSLVKGDITSSSLAFSWSKSAASNADNRYQYVCKEGSTAPTSDQWANDAVLLDEGVRAATVEGLKSNTTYYFFVRSYYGDGKYSSAINTNNTTDCGIESLEYSETFGTSSATKPGCWTISNWGTSANYWTSASDYAHSGVALKYNAKTLNSSSAISPYIYIAEKCTLCFYVRNSVGSNSAKVECQVFINDGSTDTEITNLTTNVSGTTSGVNTRHTTATAKYYDLSSFVGKTITIRFLGKGYDSGTTSALWIDDVSINYKATSAPTNLAATPTADGAEVTWDAEESPYDLRYRVNGSSDDWNLVSNIADENYTIENLTEQEYEVQVRTHASEHRISAWTASETFTPEACPTVTAVTLSDKTYNSVTVGCTLSAVGTWDLQYKAGSGDWTDAYTDIATVTKEFAVSVGTTYSFRAKSSCRNAWTEADETYAPAYPTPASVEVATTEVTATGSWAVIDGATGYEYIVVAKDAAQNWTSPSTATTTSAGIVTATPIANLNGGTEYDFYVRAVFGVNTGNAAKASFTTGKVAPTTLVKSTATANSISFSWSYSGSVNQFQWKTSKAGSQWSDVQSDKSAIATDLESGTTYTIYVRTYYAEGIYSDELSGSMNTECASKGIGYSTNFDAESALPACWESTNFGSGNNKWNIGNWYESTSAWNSARFLAYKNSGSTSADLITPAIDLTEFAMLKFFYLKNSADVVAQVLIRIPGESDEVIWTATTKSSWASIADSVDLSSYVGKTAKLIFRAYGSTSGTTRYFYLDDVSFAYKHCAKPTGLTASTTMATMKGAKITWVDNKEKGPWDLRYRTNGVGEWTAVNGITTKSYKITGLDEVEYEVQVRTHVSAHRISAWTASETFTPICSVTLNDNEDNTATLNTLLGQNVDITINRTIYCDGDYNTLCLPFSLATLTGTPLEDATVYAYKYAVLEPDELQVRIYETENGIQAGVPYLLKISAESNITSMTFSDVIITAAEGKTIGKDEAVEFIGILKPEAFTAGDESTLFVSTGNNLAWASESANLKSFRAFFKRTVSAPAPLRPGMRARIVVQEEVVTGVDGTQGNDVQCIKLIENEQLVIIRNGVKYNVQGQIIR